MIKQFLGFSAVGISSAIINFIIYNIFLALFRRFGLMPGYEYIIALIISFSLSILWCFLFSRRYVFVSEAEKAVPWHHALFKMYLSYSFTGIFFNVFMSFVWVNVFFVPKPYISLLNDTLAAPVNFLLIKFWSFRKAK